MFVLLKKFSDEFCNSVKKVAAGILKSLLANTSLGGFTISFKERKVLFVLVCLICLGLTLEYIKKTFSFVKISQNADYRDVPHSLRVNINEASFPELISLPGVGQTIALRIIKEREKEKFTTAEDLLRVKGIGKKKLEKIKKHLSF